MVWILPTLNRPKQCAAVLRSIRESGCTTPGYVFINGPSHINEYYEELTVHLDGWYIISLPENIGALGVLNLAFKMFPDQPWYGFWGDDEFVMPESPRDWDKRVIEAAGDWNLAHGWETWNNGTRFQGAAVIGGKLAKAVGYLAVKECYHGWGFDSMWEWMCTPKWFGGGECTERVYVPEVKIDHRHWMNKELAPKDECYQLAESRRVEDQKRYWDWIKTECPLAAERVIKARVLEDIRFNVI